MRELIITLDGPAGSGKSTVARLLAKRLGLEFLDTGAMYRGIAAACLDSGVDPAKDSHAAIELARRATLRFNWQADPPHLHVSGHDVTSRLRDSDVTRSVSDIAGLSAIRHVLVDAQRQIAREHPRLVTEGRDQGSVVFPHAQVKFYLDASPQIRASRRALQLRQAGREADEARILEQIQQRDTRDSNRADGPLICPHDALRIDTTALSLEQVVDLLELNVRNHAADILQDL